MPSPIRACGPRAHSRHVDGLQPELNRWWHPRTALNGIVVFLTLFLAATVGCGASTQDSNNAIAPSSKPDLADLSDRMVIAESEFPPVPDGKFMFTSVRTVDFGGDADRDQCDPSGWVREGDQEAGARVISDSTGARYNIEVFHTKTKTDLLSWAGDCLPRTEGNTSTSRIDLAGLPLGTISVEQSDNGTPRMYLAVGYIRGLLVSAYLSGGYKGGSDGMPPGAKSDLVKMFTAQAEWLASY